MLDPRKVKQRALNKSINSVLVDKQYSAEQRKMIEDFYSYINAKPDLKLGSKKNYMQNARRVLLYIKILPSDWTAKTIIEIIDNWRMKKDGSEYHPQYRNTIRTVIKYFLECNAREDLLSDIVHGSNRRLILVMTKHTVSSAI